MTFFTIIRRLLRQLILWWIGIAGLCCSVAYGQYSVIYSQYVAPDTGGTIGQGGAAGALGAPGANGSYTITNTGNLNDNIYTNYAVLTATGGKPGTGALPGAGDSSTAYINLNFSGAVTPSASNPVVLKVQASSNSNPTPLSKVTVQAYNGATLVGTVVAVSALPVRSADEYVFTPAGNCTSVRITIASDRTTLLSGSSSSITANLFYAFVFDPTCSPPVYTATNITGVLNLNGAVNDPDNAADNNITTFATFSVGLGVGLLCMRLYITGPYQMPETL